MCIRRRRQSQQVLTFILLKRANETLELKDNAFKASIFGKMFLCLTIYHSRALPSDTAATRVDLINIYIDLARAKSEALDNIYSLFKQNIKSCNAKQLRHATPEKGEKQQ